MAEYNPFKDFNPAFTQYQYLETPTKPKVTFESSLGTKYDFSDDFIERNGVYIAPPNTPETQEYVTNNYDDLFKEMGDRHFESTEDNNDYTPDVNIPTKGSLSENAKYAYQYLTKNGIPKASAAGIVGNLYNEDLGNPNRTVKDHGGTTAYGIAGFNSKGELPNLLKWAKNKGISDKPNFQQQLDYLIHCINTRPKLQILLSNNLSTKEASFIWGSEFERFRGSTNNGRGFANINDPEHKKRASVSAKLLSMYG